jgi:hypothetical protein
MSVVVKGMRIPKSCGRCWFNNSSLSCAITGTCIDRDDENRDRLDDCPIVALPDTHGRLADADATEAQIDDYFAREVKRLGFDGYEQADRETQLYLDGIINALAIVMDSPTIVESEDSE